MPRYDDRVGNSTRLYVGHLSSRTRSRDLERAFSKYGRVRDVDMKHDYAFVEFSDPRDADDARYYLDGRDIDGRRIIVEFAKGVPRGPGGSREYLGKGPAPGSGRCFNCGLEGHWARDCKAGDWKNKCYRCGERGHIERKCPNSPKKLSRRSYSRSPVRSKSPSTPLSLNAAAPPSSFFSGRRGHQPEVATPLCHHPSPAASLPVLIPLPASIFSFSPLFPLSFSPLLLSDEGRRSVTAPAKSAAGHLFSLSPSLPSSPSPTFSPLLLSPLPSLIAPSSSPFSSIFRKLPAAATNNDRQPLRPVATSAEPPASNRWQCPSLPSFSPPLFPSRLFSSPFPFSFLFIFLQVPTATGQPQRAARRPRPSPSLLRFSAGSTSGEGKIRMDLFRSIFGFKLEVQVEDQP